MEILNISAKEVNTAFKVFYKDNRDFCIANVYADGRTETCHRNPIKFYKRLAQINDMTTYAFFIAHVGKFAPEYWLAPDFWFYPEPVPKLRRLTFKAVKKIYLEMNNQNKQGARQ